MKAIWRVLIVLFTFAPHETARRVTHNVRLIRCAGTSNDDVRSDERVLPILRVKRVHRVYDLGEIVLCLRALGLILNGFESGKQQANQNRNDRDDHQQLDESESPVSSGGRVRSPEKGGCQAQVPCGSGVHRGDSMSDK